MREGKKNFAKFKVYDCLLLFTFKYQILDFTTKYEILPKTWDYMGKNSIINKTGSTQKQPNRTRVNFWPVLFPGSFLWNHLLRNEKCAHHCLNYTVTAANEWGLTKYFGLGPNLPFSRNWSATSSNNCFCMTTLDINKGQY